MTSSNDGRIVSAVVCVAPLTIPSTIPSATIIVPKYETSDTTSRAWSTVTPLCARRAAYSAAKRSSSSGSFGSTMCAP